MCGRSARGSCCCGQKVRGEDEKTCYSFDFVAAVMFCLVDC